MPGWSVVSRHASFAALGVGHEGLVFIIIRLNHDERNKMTDEQRRRMSERWIGIVGMEPGVNRISGSFGRDLRLRPLREPTGPSDQTL